MARAEEAGDSLATEIRHQQVVVVIMAVLAVAVFVVLGNTSLGDDLSFSYPVAIVGAGAATANNVQRMLQKRTGDGANTGRLDRRLVIAQIYLSPAIGATFAAVAYVLFMSGILQGDFFPEFTCASTDYETYEAFAECNPATNADASKAVVWAFAAGFAERFVPNVLDSIIPKSASTE